MSNEKRVTADATRCAGCGQPLGAQRIYNGLGQFHPSCAAAHTPQSAQGRLVQLGELVTQDGKLVSPEIAKLMCESAQGSPEVGEHAEGAPHRVGCDGTPESCPHADHAQGPPSCRAQPPEAGLPERAAGAPAPSAKDIAKRLVECFSEGQRRSDGSMALHPNRERWYIADAYRLANLVLGEQVPYDGPRPTFADYEPASAPAESEDDKWAALDRVLSPSIDPNCPHSYLSADMRDRILALAAERDAWQGDARRLNKMCGDAEAERDAAVQRAEAAERAAEVERLRLTACSLAATGYFQGCNDEYLSASLTDVLTLRAENECLREPLEAATREKRCSCERAAVIADSALAGEAVGDLIRAACARECGE
jgi:hypothetical protein